MSHDIQKLKDMTDKVEQTVWIQFTMKKKQKFVKKQIKQINIMMMLSNHYSIEMHSGSDGIPSHRFKT